MLIKEKLKSEIDRISDELAEKVYKLIQLENRKEKSDEKVEWISYHLGKELDKIDVRKSAYK